MVINGFWHVGLPVSDMERSILFYRDAIGLEVRRRGHTSDAAAEVWNAPAGSGGEVVFLGVPGIDADVVELLCHHGMDRKDSSAAPWDIASAHMCFETHDLAELFARVQRLGYRAVSSGPVALRGGVIMGGYSIYLVDPDGFYVEVVQRPSAEAV